MKAPHQKNRESGLPARSMQAGVTILLVIAFMGIFLIIMGTITSYAFTLSRYGRALYNREQALHAAEAGLEYYRWFLAHNPNNLTNGTGQAGPYTYTVNDPEGGVLGTASISVVGNTQCGIVQSIDITSTGRSALNVNMPRTVTARYMQQSVAWYSYILNSNVWAGPDRNITGPYFSNGGIRMDGTNNSDVSSAVATWICDSGYNCSPTQNSAPGVIGNGSGSALWHYPASSINFAGMQANLTTMKTRAQNNGGLYFAPASGSQNQRGYHLIFNNNGTVTVRRVSATNSVPSYSLDSNDLSRYSGSTFVGWTTAEYSIIKTETLVGTYAIPPACSLIFVEDRAWIEGTVNGKVTVVVATPSDGVAATVTSNAYLPNNILYATNDGTTGLTVIAEDSILIPVNSPDTMTLNGIFVAQGGLYGRNFYTNDSSYPSNYRVGSTYSAGVLQTQLTTEGSVVSNMRTGTSWLSGGAVVSGYQSRIDAFDQLQATNPPPFTPASTPNYSFVSWKEQ